MEQRGRRKLIFEHHRKNQIHKTIENMDKVIVNCEKLMEILKQ